MKSRNPESIEMPFLGFLLDLSLQHFKSPHYFDYGTFFWSLTRLFECYQRIIPYCQNYKGTLSNPFLAQDIENFIIRHNVLLNDLAYILRKFYTEKELRSMKGLSGDTASSNREQSFNDLLVYFTKKNLIVHPSLSALLKEKSIFLQATMRKRRLDILHYKAKAVVFEFEKEPRFALIDVGGTYQTEKMENGEEKIVTESVFEFVNEAMKSTVNFINEDILSIFKDYASAKGWKYNLTHGRSEVTAIGVELYKTINC